MSNLKIYCQSCGAAHAFTMQKPKFCQSCGQAFSDTVAKTTSSPASLEIEEESFNSNLTQLECDFTDYTPQVQTLGSIMDQNQASSNPIKPTAHREPRNNLSAEQTLEQLKKESSAIRPKSS
jgi:hypothetical protein